MMFSGGRERVQWERMVTSKVPLHQILLIHIAIHEMFSIKGTLMRFEDLPICFCSYKNNILKISHSES